MNEVDWQRLLDDVAHRSAGYLDTMTDRRVAPDDAALRGLDRFDEPLPDRPCDPRETLALLDDAGSPATVASTGPRYFGFVTGGTHPTALAAGWLGTAWDQNAALEVMSPVAHTVRSVVRAWLLDLLGVPGGCAVSFVTGATMANATALVAARDAQLAAAGWDVQHDGLFGAPPVTVVVGERAHSVIYKALGMIGLGRRRVATVPVDDQGRIRADALPDVDGPVIVCAQAGEVNTGAFDPFPDIARWAEGHRAWLHVDGAFGLWAAADPAHRDLCRGLGRADSWATDAHKWLNCSYDSGIAFVRDPAHLARSFSAAAAYLPDAPDEPMNHAPQSSQRARQLEIWAVLRTLGRSGLADLVARSCRHARRIAEALDAAGLQIVNEVVLNQVLVAAADDETTTALLTAIQRDGTCWCGPSRWGGRDVIRISVSGWNTTDDDVEHSIDAIVRCARQVSRRHH